MDEKSSLSCVGRTSVWSKQSKRQARATSGDSIENPSNKPCSCPQIQTSLTAQPQLVFSVLSSLIFPCLLILLRHSFGLSQIVSFLPPKLPFRISASAFVLRFRNLVYSPVSVSYLGLNCTMARIFVLAALASSFTFVSSAGGVGRSAGRGVS